MLYICVNLNKMSEVNQHISKLREDFLKGTLSEQDVNLFPDIQFEKWMQEAVEGKVTEVQACTLSTVSADLKPNSRIIYLREFAKHDFYFYTNFNSKKAQDIASNNNVCITFFWPELERQIRIEGKAFKASDEKSDAYFKVRPRDSQIGAWSSPQSKKIADRNVLEEIITITSNLLEGKEIKRPDYWGGYVIQANYYEFWQGRKNRLHDRICYTLENQNWKIERLAP
jgi:pyridoxamine 5'-phosphate oxidase